MEGVLSARHWLISIAIFPCAALLTACAEEDMSRGEAFVVVHMEVHEGDARETVSLDYQEEYWPELVDLVDLADEFGLPLTLLFNPQWGEYILPDADRLATVQAWEAGGHELGIHHHGLGYASEWNGFSNDPSAVNTDGYRGSIEEMMEFLRPMSVEGMVTFAGSDADTDLPKGIEVVAVGTSGELVSAPSQTSLGGDTYDLIEYQAFVGLPGAQDMLDQLPSVLERTRGGTVFGTAFHEADWAANRDQVKRLFEILAQQDVPVRRCESIPR